MDILIEFVKVFPVLVKKHKNQSIGMDQVMNDKLQKLLRPKVNFDAEE